MRVPEIKILSERCVRCGDCILLCPQSGKGVNYPVFTPAGDSGEVDVAVAENCIGCLTCVEFCRSAAVVVSAGTYTANSQPEVYPVRPVSKII